ncbi:MAG: tetratricopeptide repeat protein [Acidobacteria bacterium]|nr:tetratricopeptide repeat protein [Acidobacteriota bacterium]
MGTATARADSGRLDSWKEIAGYMRRGIRTVQRWEREEGLPVHRLPHEKLGSVYAYKHEIDAWFSRRGEEAKTAAPAPSALPSLAVLPFQDLSAEKDQTYLCDGIAEEILSGLSRLAGLRTASRTSSFQYRAGGSDSREIGKKLGVGTLLEGSVRKSGDRLRVAVRLIEVAGGFQLWADRYEGSLHDVFTIQDEIAESVVRALRVTLKPGEDPAHLRQGTADIGAWECYQRGRQFYYQYSPRAIEFAIQMFVRAIQLDPNYAQAWAGLADCWSYTYLYSDRRDALREQADWASQKAWEMNPHSAQVQASRGLALSLKGRNDEADRAFEAAIELDPGLFEAHYFRARHCFALGRSEEAVASYEKAMEARPEDFQSRLLVAQSYEDLGKPERAAAVRREGITLAECHLELNPDDARALYMAANGLAALGDSARARRYAERARAISPEDPMLLYNVGCIFSLLGLPDQAIECLEGAVRGGLSQRGWFEHDSNLDALRALPRFRALLSSLL